MARAEAGQAPATTRQRPAAPVRMIRSPICSKCRLELRQGRQRWCRGCRTTHERERRQRLRQLGPQRRTAPEPTGPMLPPGVTDLGFGVEVYGARHQPGFPGRPCGQAFPARRSSQTYCCSGHGAGNQGHSVECPLLQAKQARPAPAVPRRRVERSGVVAAPSPSAWAPIRSAPERRPTGAPRAKRRGLWDSAEIERRKQIVARIAKSQRPPSEYRVSSFMADSGHRYIDLRVYKGSGHPLPTRIGLPIHFDKVPDVIEALRDALRREAEPGRVACLGATREPWPEGAEASVREVDGWAAEGTATGSGIAGPWDVDDGWGAWGQRR